MFEENFTFHTSLYTNDSGEVASCVCSVQPARVCCNIGYAACRDVACSSLCAS